MRARELLVDHLAEPREPVELGGARCLSLAAQVGFLVIEQIEGQPAAIAREHPARTHGVASSRVEHVRAHDAKTRERSSFG